MAFGVFDAAAAISISLIVGLLEHGGCLAHRALEETTLFEGDGPMSGLAETGLKPGSHYGGDPSKLSSNCAASTVTWKMRQS